MKSVLQKSITLLLITLLVSLFCISGLWGIEITGLPADDLINLALTENTAIREAADKVTEAERIKNTLTLEKSSLGLSGGYSYNFTNPPADPITGLSGSLDLSVPVIPQLRLNGKIDTSGKGNVSLTAIPFADNELTPAEEMNYTKAVLNLEYLRQSILYSIEKNLLNAVLEEKKTILAEQIYNLAEKQYQTAKQSYNLGETPYDELLAKESSLAEKREKYFTALKNEANVHKGIYQIAGEIPESIQLIPQLTLDDLTALTEKRKEQLSAMDNSQGTTQDLENLRLEYSAQKEDLNSTWAFEPDLSLSAGVTFPDPVVSGTIKFTISPNQFKSEELESGKTALDIKADELSSAEFILEIEMEIARKMISITEEALTSALFNLDQQKISYRESIFLHSEGERTNLELQESELLLESAKLNAFQAAADLYLAQNDYAAFFIFVP